MTKLVFVSVGTDHHRFGRLIDWVVRLSAGRPDLDWFVQAGAVALPTDLNGAPMLAVERLTNLLESADVVVTHGGPGMILEARQHGHLPVVVPRDPALGEHVDDHQLRFTARLAGEDRIIRATSYKAFVHGVDEALARGRRNKEVGASGAEAIRRFSALVDDTLVKRRQ